MNLHGLGMNDGICISKRDCYSDIGAGKYASCVYNVVFGEILLYNQCEKSMGAFAMRIVICDDETLSISTIKVLIQRWKTQRRVDSISLSIYESSEELHNVINNAIPFDVAFLDIQFPREIGGLQLAEYLRQTNEDMQIVFVSNYGQYAMEGYKASALRYLQKPITQAQIFECLDISYRQWLFRQESSIVLMDNKQAVKIAPKSIIYAETQGHYIEIHLTTMKNAIQIRMRLAELRKLLTDGFFVQCHRCYIVNLLHIQRITRTSILLLNGISIPLSTRNWENVMLQFKKVFQGENNAYTLDSI